MSNMSYCRYRNTLRDLLDCKQALLEESQEDIDNMDDEESAARDRLIAVCEKIAADFGVGDA